MRYRDKTLNYLSFILEIFDQPWKSHITTLSYWKTCNQISACAVVLQSGVKAKLLKKVFVPSLVLERPASVRSIYWIEKLRGPTTRRTLHTYILTNISGFIRFSYGGNCLFQGNVKENSDIFYRVLIYLENVMCHSVILRNIICTCWCVLVSFKIIIQIWRDLT